MKRTALALAFFLLAACTPAGQPPPDPTVPSGPEEIPWEGKPTPVQPTPSPVPSPVWPDEVPVPDVERRYVPDNEAMRFAAAMAPGWNLGNTLDSHGDRNAGVLSEISWGNPKTTQAMLDFLKASGFNSFRVPVTWNGHVDEDFTIDPAWLDRVREVVDYGMNAGLTVILNIHHDDDVEFVYPDSAHYETSSRYVKRVWEQLAAHFRDYGEKLVFEGLNEPRLKGSRFEWGQDYNDPVCVDALDTLCRLQQDFVDTVRASGGQNAARYLMVCGLGANTDSVSQEMYRLPEDTAENRIMISVHAYEPYGFALQNKGNTEFDMTARGSVRSINNFMDRVYDKYAANGIPVVIGECGARDQSGNLRDRTEWAAYYFASASARGMPALWWDNGSFSGAGELFGLLDRRAVQWVYPGIAETIVRYSLIEF